MFFKYFLVVGQLFIIIVSMKSAKDTALADLTELSFKMLAMMFIGLATVVYLLKV